MKILHHMGALLDLTGDTTRQIFRRLVKHPSKHPRRRTNYDYRDWEKIIVTKEIK